MLKDGQCYHQNYICLGQIQILYDKFLQKTWRGVMADSWGHYNTDTGEVLELFYIDKVRYHCKSL